MESVQENQNNDVSVEAVEPQSKNLDAVAEPIQEGEKNKDQECKNKSDSTPADEDDDSLDELSAIKIASALIDETFSLDDPELVIPEHFNEAYKNIVITCDVTAQSIKKTISEVINRQSSVVITEVDPTTELEENLNKKIADFEKVVSSTFESTSSVETDADIKTAAQADHPEESAPVTSDESKNENIDTKTISISEENSTAGAKTTDIKSNYTILKTDEKISNSDNKKREPTPEVQNFITASTSQSQTADSFKDIFKNSTITFEDEKLSKKQKNSSKKKGEKTVDQLLKSLGNGTVEEKLHLLCKKHLEVQEEYRLVEPRLRQLERQVISQQREKEQLQAELNRMILAKSRLEGLCREMQRQSKAVKEENLLRIKEEEEKRKEIATKFQSTLNDISHLMKENSTKNVQLREENSQLASKLKSLVENYEVWEQNMGKIVQQKELEAQLAKAKHAKVNLLLKQETEKFLREKQSLLENLSELQKRCTLLTTNELKLRTELGDYTSKYEEFQNVLSNSSKVFATFKNDMESTSKKIKKLEKETNVYKQKWESSNNALLDMISHKEKQDKEFSNAQQRILTLEKLCRALQAERNELRNQLNVQNSTITSTTTPGVPSHTPETESTTPSVTATATA